MFGISDFCGPCWKVMNPDDELYQLCKYMVKCTNLFFRTVREHGIWLRGRVCTTARTAGDEMNVAWWFTSLSPSLGQALTY